MITRRVFFKLMGAVGLGSLLPAAPPAASPIVLESALVVSPSQAAAALGELAGIGVADGIAKGLAGNPWHSLPAAAQVLAYRPDEWLDLPAADAEALAGMVQYAALWEPPSNAELNRRLIIAEEQIRGLVTSLEGLTDRIEPLERNAGSPGPHPSRIEPA